MSTYYYSFLNIINIRRTFAQYIVLLSNHLKINNSKYYYGLREKDPS